MAYFNSKQVKYIPQPIPENPGTYPVDPPTPPTPTPGTDPSVPRPTFTGTTSFTIGVTSDERIVVNKSMSSVLNGTLDVKEPCDLLSPTIVIASNTDIRNCNYLNIFGRYYFITSITLLPGGGLYQVSAKEDVLKTYANEIKAQRAIVARSSQTYNKYLQDRAFKIYSYKNTRTLKFTGGTGFSKTLDFVLVTIGGPDSE